MNESWLLERRMPVSVAAASMMMSSQFTARPCCHLMVH
jgi:hypothetical protein